MRTKEQKEIERLKGNLIRLTKKMWAEKLKYLNQELDWLHGFKKTAGGLMLLCIYNHITNREDEVKSQIKKITAKTGSKEGGKDE